MILSTAKFFSAGLGKSLNAHIKGIFGKSCIKLQAFNTVSNRHYKDENLF